MLPKVELVPALGLKDKGRAGHHFPKRLLYGEPQQCDLWCREPEPGSLFFLPADIPLSSLAKPCSRPQGGEPLGMLHSAQHPGQKAGWRRFKSDSGEARGRCLGHLNILPDWLALVVRYLWRSQVVGGLCFGVRESDAESALLHLVTERFSGLFSSPRPYFLVASWEKGTAYIRTPWGGSNQKIFQCC